MSRGGVSAQITGVPVGPELIAVLATLGPVPWREFARPRDGMIHAMDGGLWLHRHVWKGTPMAHLVSTDRAPAIFVRAG